jgi:uncharacterized membrane protein YphA (DoxX/SURF4 family)
MTTTAGVLLLIGRILFVAMFVNSARGHIVNHAMYTGIARSKNLPLSYVAGRPAGVFLALGCLSLVLGIWIDIGTLMLMAFLIPTTILFHPFWTFSDPAERRTQLGSFSRNVSLFGGSLILFAFAVSLSPLPYTITGAAISLR